MAAPAQPVAKATTQPNLLERLQRSMLISSPAWSSIVRMAKTHSGHSSKEDAQHLRAFAQTSQRTLWGRLSNTLGTLHDGKVAVSLSSIGSHEGNNETEQKEQRHSLGLFAALAISKGGWVTAYGGVQEWPAERRSQVKNTHSRRIPDSGFIWNGRPWALLFSDQQIYLIY